ARGAMHIACTSAAIWYALTYLRFYDSTPEEEQGNYRAPVLARLAAAAARPSSRDCRGGEGSRSRCRCAIRSERRAAQAAWGASAGLRRGTANLDREERGPGDVDSFGSGSLAQRCSLSPSELSATATSRLSLSLSSHPPPHRDMR